MYLCESLTIHAPTKRLIAKKCNQKIKRKPSSENIEYKPSKPLYNSKLSNIFPLLNILIATNTYAEAKIKGAIIDCIKKFVKKLLGIIKSINQKGITPQFAIK